MGALVKLSDADLQAIADDTLGRALGDIDVKGIRAGAGHDHDGDPAVFMVVSMPLGSDIIPPRLLATARVALFNVLQGRGDERLVYLSVDWPDEAIPPSPDVPT